MNDLFPTLLVACCTVAACGGSSTATGGSPSELANEAAGGASFGGRAGSSQGGSDAAGTGGGDTSGGGSGGAGNGAAGNATSGSAGISAEAGAAGAAGESAGGAGGAGGMVEERCVDASGNEPGPTAWTTVVNKNCCLYQGVSSCSMTPGHVTWFCGPGVSIQAIKQQCGPGDEPVPNDAGSWWCCPP